VRTIGLAVALAAAVGTESGYSQEPIRAGVVGRPKPGQRAPEIVLPYFTSAGPGPADQPFRRSAELGRVLVIVFGPRNESQWWSAVAAAADSAWPAAVLVGVVRGTPGEVALVAGGLPNDRAKLLADSTGHAGRAFGVGANGRAAFVVGDDGRVGFVSERFDPNAATTVARIATAVRPDGRP